MSRIIVKFKKPVDYDTRTEQAVSVICDLFGFASPWFNDDAWFDDNRRTLVIGSGYNDTNVNGKIDVLRTLYEKEIDEIYEELDDDEQSELKPCPFCGRAVKIIHAEPSGYNVAYFNDEYAVAIAHAGEGECVIDSLMSFNQREESMMANLWNRRASE